MGPFIPPFAVFKTESREVLTWNLWYFSLRWYMYINLANFNTCWHTQVPVCMQVVNSNINVWQKFQNSAANRTTFMKLHKVPTGYYVVKKKNSALAWNWTLLKCILHILYSSLWHLGGLQVAKSLKIHSIHGMGSSGGVSSVQLHLLAIVCGFMTSICDWCDVLYVATKDCHGG